MNTISNRTIALLRANEKGYKVEENRLINPKGRQLSPSKDNSGYPRFGIRINGICLSVSVHRLVAYQKYGNKIFGDGIQVRHLDGNPANFHPSNISIGTSSENQMDKPSHVRLSCAINASKSMRKHSKEKVSLMRLDRENGMTYPQLMIKYGIKSKGSLHNILNSKSVTDAILH